MVRNRESEFDERVVQVNRVSRKTKGGNAISFSVLTVVGNRKGEVGIGLGKAPDVTGAIQKALRTARRSMFKVKMRGGTIPHWVEAKYKAARVLLKPAPPGTGVIAGGAVRAVVEAAGVHNVVSKVLGSSNKLTNVKATVEALKALEQPRKIGGQVKPDRRSVTKAGKELSLTDLALPGRTLKLLQQAGFVSLGELKGQDLTRIKGIGPERAKAIRKILNEA